MSDIVGPTLSMLVGEPLDGVGASNW